MTDVKVESGCLLIDLRSVPEELHAAIEQSREDWESAGQLRDGRLCLTQDDWIAYGAPVLPTSEAEEQAYWREDWAAAHDLFCRLLGLEKQTLHFDLVGFFGAAGAQLELRVDGGPPLKSSDSGFAAWEPPAAVQPFAPLTARVAQRVLSFPASDRKAQLGWWAQLRSELSALPTLLEIPIVVSFDEHLSTIQPETPARFTLEWEPTGPGDRATLTTKVLSPDGTRRTLSYEGFDPRGFVVDDAKHPVVLPAAVAEVMSEARKRDRKHIPDVAAEIADPTRVIPEGVEVDRYFDLSLYSDRIAGFELVKRGDPKPISISGIQWFDGNPELSAAFMQLYAEDTQTGTRRQLSVETREAAASLLEETDSALTSGAPSVTSFGVRPTSALRDQLAAALEVSKLKPDAPKEEGLPRSGTYAAIVKDLEAAADDLDGPVIDESGVPWHVLEAALKPGYALKTHQRRGLAWLWKHLEGGTPGVLLADDMGLGKTLQAAALLVLRRKIRPEGRNLLVCPTVLLDTWLEELDKFFGLETFGNTVVLHDEGLRTFVRGGTLNVLELATSRLVLTNYETLARHQKSLLQLDFDLVFFDEAQHIKNSDTLRARAARGLKRHFAVALTGTPVENALVDLWAIYDAIQTKQKRAFGTKDDFNKSLSSSAESSISALRKRLQFPSPRSSLLRREKSQALRDLPPKRIVVHRAEMTSAQLELERIIQKEAKTRGTLGALQQLRKLYQHPFLLTDKSDRLSAETATLHSPKTKLCLSVLDDIAREGGKALVFTLSLRMQSVLAQLFTSHFSLPFVDIINGDPAKRSRALESIRRFSARQGFNVMILSPIAAGVGLTITAANHVIHYERWWNPAKEDQATDRAHRIGQTKPVTVHYPILHRPNDPLSGFDVRLHELVERKRGIARDFLSPADEFEVTSKDVNDVFREDEP